MLAFGLMGLGLCVFAWGLRYKLSLYDPPHSISHRMPAAKLLPGPKRTGMPRATPGRSQDGTAPLALGLLAFVSLLLLGAKLWAASPGRLVDPEAMGWPPQCSGIGGIFTRPPPFLADI